MVSLRGGSTHRTVYPIRIPLVYAWLLNRRVFFIMIIYHFDGTNIQILKNIALCYHNVDLCIYISFSKCTHPMFNLNLIERVAP